MSSLVNECWFDFIHVYSQSYFRGCYHGQHYRFAYLMTISNDAIVLLVCYSKQLSGLCYIQMLCTRSSIHLDVFFLIHCDKTIKSVSKSKNSLEKCRGFLLETKKSLTKWFWHSGRNCDSLEQNDSAQMTRETKQRGWNRLLIRMRNIPLTKVLNKIVWFSIL